MTSKLKIKNRQRTTENTEKLVLPNNRTHIKQNDDHTDIMHKIQFRSSFKES